jgi:hypothetical protein
MAARLFCFQTLAHETMGTEGSVNGKNLTKFFEHKKAVSSYSSATPLFLKAIFA